MIELRPLSLGELLDRTFTYYRGHFWLFVGIMAVPEVFIVAGQLAIAWSLPVTARTTQSPVVMASRLPHLMAGLITGYFLIILVYLFGVAIALGAASSAVSEIYAGHELGVREAYRKLRGKVLRLIGTTVLFLFISIGAYVAAVLGGVIVALIPTFLLGRILGPSLLVKVLIGFLIAIIVCAFILLAAVVILRYGVAIPALVIEDLGAWRALKRSASLTKGFLWRVFVIWFLMTLVAFVMAMVFQAPVWVAGLLIKGKLAAGPAWLAAPRALASGVGGAVGGPLLIIALALLYYDARVRKEGLDLQLMIKALDANPGAGPAGPLHEPTPGMPPLTS